MENVWAGLSKDVYGKGKSHNRVSDLKEAIYSAWEKLSLHFAANLIECMPNNFLMSFVLKIKSFLKINAKCV